MSAVSQFLASQLDYTLFVYTLAFIILAGVCVTLKPVEEKPIPWHWLGLFAIIHGVHEWLELIELQTGESELLKIAITSLSIISFTSFFEFGRETLANHYSRCPGRVLLLAPLLLTLLGLIQGSESTEAAIRYAIALPGALLSGFALFRIAGRKRSGFYLRTAGAALILYGIAAGLVVPAAPFFPASALNSGSFFAATGIPIQLVRAFLAFSLSFVVWKYSQALRHAAAVSAGLKRKMIIGFFFAPVLIAAAVLGWIATEVGQATIEHEQGGSLIALSKIVAASVDENLVEALTGSSNDLGNPNYLTLKRKLADVRAANPDIRFVYLMGMRNGEVFFYVDSEPPQSKDYSPPGQLYAEADADTVMSFSASQPFVAKPSIDRWGEWISALVPIFDKESEKRVCVLGVDMDRRVWRKAINERRLANIQLTLLLSVIIISFFVAIQIANESEQKTAASETKYRIASDYSFNWEFWLGVDMRFVYISLACKEITGYDREDFYEGPELLAKIIHPDDLAPFLDHHSQKEFRGPPHSLEFRIVRNDGQERWISHLCRPVYADDGKFLGRRGTNIDITARKEADRKIRENEVRFRSVVNASKDAIIALNDRGNISLFNPAAQEMFQSGEAEVLGKRLAVLMPESYRDIHNETLESYLATGKPDSVIGKTLELEGLRADGTVFAVEVSISRAAPAGEIMVLGVLRDITARRKADENLKRADEELMKSRERTAVLSTVITYNHELNNPLMILLASLELLKESGVADVLSADQAKLLIRAEDAGVRLDKVITELSNIMQPAFETYSGDDSMLSLKDGETDTMKGR